MKNQKFETILERIARDNHTTKQHVRQEMQLSMDLAMNSQDPIIQARWASIPKKGKKLTLEEFVAYMASQLPGRQK